MGLLQTNFPFSSVRSILFVDRLYPAQIISSVGVACLFSRCVQISCDKPAGYINVAVFMQGYLAAFFSARDKCLSLSLISPQGEPGGFLPLSIPHLILGFLRSTSA